MKSGTKQFTILALLAAAVPIGIARAGDIEWPSDFWTQVTNHVTAVAPGAAQKGEASNGEWSRGDVRKEVAVASPIDTRSMSEGETAVIEVVTTRGAMLLIR